MTLMGKATLTVKRTGRYGGRVRLGRFLVPKCVFLEIIGDEDAPDLHARFEFRDGRPQAVDMHFVAKPDGRGLRPSDIETLNIDALARFVFEEHTRIIQSEQEMREFGFTPDAGITVAGAPNWADARFDNDRWELQGHLVAAASAPGRGVSVAQLGRIAEVYRQHAGEGALSAVAAALGVSERTAARRVNAARDAGLLPPRERGKG